jgi:hypothetical protein
MDTGDDLVLLGTLHLKVSSDLKEQIASGLLDFSDTLLAHGTHRQSKSTRNGVNEFLDHGRLLGSELLRPPDINLVENDDEGLVAEKREDRVEQVALLLDTVTALLGNINKVENSAAKVSKSCDGLHFNSVSVFEGLIENTRGIDDLPSQILS